MPPVQELDFFHVRKSHLAGIYGSPNNNDEADYDDEDHTVINDLKDRTFLCNKNVKI